MYMEYTHPLTLNFGDLNCVLDRLRLDICAVDLLSKHFSVMFNLFLSPNDKAYEHIDQSLASS